MTGDGLRDDDGQSPVDETLPQRVARQSGRVFRATSVGVVRATRWPGQQLAAAQQRSIDKAVVGSSVAMVYWPDPRSAKDQKKAADRLEKRAKKGKGPSRFFHGPLLGWHPGIKPLARIDFAFDAVFAVAGVLIAVFLHALITAALLTFLVGFHVRSRRESNRLAGSRQETPAQKARRDKRRPEFWVMALVALVMLAWFLFEPYSLRVALIVLMVFIGVYSLLANRLDMIVIRADGYSVRVHGVFSRSTPRIFLHDARLLAAKDLTGTVWGHLTVDSASSEDGEFRGWGFTTYPEQFVAILQNVKDNGVPSPPGAQRG